MKSKNLTPVPHHRKQHEAHQHNAAPRLEGAVKNVGIKPGKKEKKRHFALEMLYPEWLLRAQAAVRGI